MSHRRVRSILVLAALVCAFAAASFAADSMARIVRLSYLDGRVDMDRGDDIDRAFLNMPVVEGARLNTGDDGYAEAEFEAGGTVRLTPRSAVVFRELRLRDSGDKVSFIEQREGTVYYNVKKDRDDDFRVLVEGQEVRAPKSSRFRIDMTRDAARIAVFKGELELAGAGRDVEVRKGETLTLDLNDPGRYFLEREIATLAYDRWDRERDGYRDRYASRSGSFRGYSSGYSWGLADLNFFGSYYWTPAYGYVWRPFGYGYGWDPFMDGAWVWYPGWGWTWVSSYPWGWAPYRYGRWVYIGGHGWCWQPGRHWRRWRPYTTVYDPPSNFKTPQPPPPPGGGGGGGGGGGSVGGGTGGRRQPGVVVIGTGPVTGGRPIDVTRLDPDRDRRLRERPATGAGGGVQLPGAVTPGVLPTREALDALARERAEARAAVASDAKGGAVVRFRRPVPDREDTATPAGGAAAQPAQPATPATPGVQPATPAQPAAPSPAATYGGGGGVERAPRQDVAPPRATPATPATPTVQPATPAQPSVQPAPRPSAPPPRSVDRPSSPPPSSSAQPRSSSGSSSGGGSRSSSSAPAPRPSSPPPAKSSPPPRSQRSPD